MKKILVSQCLYGDKPVRYDGKTKEERDPRFIRWKEENRLIPVCPEVDGGLPVPRTDAQRIGDQVITRDGRDVTKEYRRGAEIALERALQEEVLCAVLKEKSPSCGSNKVYDGTFEGNLIDGQGITVQMLREAGVRVYSEEELDLVEQMVTGRENIILTFVGAAVGAVLGRILHLFVIQTVEVDAAMFGRNINLPSYLYSLAFTVAFSFIVNGVMYFKLRKIDMVESLKSVE